MPTVEGRSHATEHHYVAERFFGRSKNRKDKRSPLFDACPWELEGKRDVYCYECHEVVLHNPVFTPADIAAFAQLVRQRGLNETEKVESCEKLAGRVRLLHEIIAAGLAAIQQQQQQQQQPPSK